jgi:hypothetical protein
LNISHGPRPMRACIGLGLSNHSSFCFRCFKPAPNQITSVDELVRGRPPLRPLARELLRFAREVAWPPRLAKIAATDREGSIAGKIAVRSPCTLM